MKLLRLLIAFVVSMAIGALISYTLHLRGSGSTVTSSLPNKKLGNKSVAPDYLPSVPATVSPTTSATLPASPSTASSSALGLSVLEIDRRQILEALKRTETSLDTPELRETRRRLIAQFIALDPPMALSYVDTLSGEEYRRQKVHAMSAWAARDPHAAADYFVENELIGGFTSDEARAAAAAIAREWVIYEPQAAFAWVSQLPEEARAESISAMVVRLAKYDPRIARDMVDSLNEGYERAEAMRPLAEQWAQRSPVVATAWVDSLRSESERNYAASGLITGWMKVDSNAAIQWLSNMPNGSTRDAAIAAMVLTETALKTPATALTWASSISDPQLRNQIYPQVLHHWQTHDPLPPNAGSPPSGK